MHRSPYPTAPVDSGYAWARLLVAVILTTVGCAGMYMAMVGLPAFQGAFEVGRGDASLPFTFVMLGFGVGSLVIGRIVDRYGVVLPLVGSSLALALGFTWAARSTSYPAFVAAHLVIGAFGCAAVFSPLLADISQWFERRRGLALAICASGNYLAGVVWPPIMQTTLAGWGWQVTYYALAIASVGIMLPLLLGLRRTPVGMMPGVDGGGSLGSPDALGLSPRTLVLLLCVAGVGCCMAMAMPQAHVVSLAADIGLDAVHGARMLSLMFGLGIVSRLLFGWISDRLGGLGTLLLGSSAQCLALTFFLPADTLTTLYVAAGLFGLFQGGIVPCYALVVREYFPATSAATLIGVIIFSTLLGMAGGGWISGAIFDWTGSYDAAFLHGIGWNVVNMVVIGVLVFRAHAGRPPRIDKQAVAPRSLEAASGS